MTRELGREEQRARRALSKEFDRAIKARAKGSGWRFASGTLFQEFRGWFVSVKASVWVAQPTTRIELRVKPMALDPVFWEIVETPTNGDLPLSFRENGSWTCRTPAFAADELDELGPDVTALADSALAWAKGKLATIESLSTESFLEWLSAHPRRNAHIATLVGALILAGHLDRARQLCIEGLERGESGGFSITRDTARSDSFFALAINWLQLHAQRVH